MTDLARFSCFQAHQPLGCRPSTCRCPQIAHPNPVVDGCSQHEVEVELVTPYEPAFAQPADGLEPAEAFFDMLPDRQAGSASGAAGGASVDGRGTVGNVLVHMWLRMGTCVSHPPTPWCHSSCPRPPSPCMYRRALRSWRWLPLARPCPTPGSPGHPRSAHDGFPSAAVPCG